MLYSMLHNVIVFNNVIMIAVLYCMELVKQTVERNDNSRDILNSRNTKRNTEVWIDRGYFNF